MSDDSIFYYREDIWIKEFRYGGLPQDDFSKGVLEPLIYIDEDESKNELVIVVDTPLLDVNTLKISLLDEYHLQLECMLRRNISPTLFHEGISAIPIKCYKAKIHLPKPAKKINRISVRKDVILIRLAIL